MGFIEDLKLLMEEEYGYINPSLVDVRDFIARKDIDMGNGDLVRSIERMRATFERAATVTATSTSASSSIKTKKTEPSERIKEDESMAYRGYSYANNWDDIVEGLLNIDSDEMADEEGNEIQILKITDYTLLENPNIQVPNKMDLYRDLDITVKDKLFFEHNDKDAYDHTVLFVNGEDRAIGFFTYETYEVDGECKHFLTAEANNIDFEDHKSTKYFFVFHCKDKMYKVPIEVQYHDTETTSTHLCIDFGTSNTTIGCYLDDHYVGDISNLAKINGNVTLNAENVTTFMDKEIIDSKTGIESYELKRLVPTVVYVSDCSNPDDIVYAFGYEATRKMKDDNYCPKASCFMEIKRWTSNLDKYEDIQDPYGNKATVERKAIIAEYLRYIIRAAENQFKCKFKNVHISAPVKLKDKVLDFYEEILAGFGYVLEKKNAIDEGIAVLYSIINNQIKDNNYENGRREKALIIDCGGGTSDLASCEYVIDKDEDGIINLDVNTEYMNGDVNFGGNNLTYRIMQYMKVVYVSLIQKTPRPNIDEIIDIDTNAIFSFIEGELENDEDSRVKERYEEVYRGLVQKYAEAENIIPTRYSEYENQTKEIYDKVKNNFYFLWKLAEEMKKEFYRSTSISRYKFYKDGSDERDIDLHVNKVEYWRLSTVTLNGTLKEQPYPDITFTAKEIDKLLRADIYYLVRKFLNDLYMEKTLDTYSQIKLSGQSSKINIFMDSLKEFLPGKKIKSGRINSKGNDAEELKLLCLKGAIMYMYALEKSNIEVSMRNETKNIPISVYIRTQNDEEKEMIKQGNDWNQHANKGRITSAGKVVYLYLRNADKEIGEPYKYVCEDIKYKEFKPDELIKFSNGRVTQEDLDTLPENKRYFFVFLNKDRWGFNIVPVYREGAKLFKGKEVFCSFEMDMVQESFFDGRK